MNEVIIAVDFDGTCVEHEYPEIGPDVPYAADTLRMLVAFGVKLILFTMRDGDHLAAAVKWFTDRGIPLYGVNENPDQKAWTSSPKAYANLYIDDAAIGCPLVYPEKETLKRPYVDWLSVGRQLGLNVLNIPQGAR